MHGFQLWANLPSSLKMTEPRYQDVAATDIPVVTDDDGTSARIICGEFWGKRGPVDGIAAEPQYLDIHVQEFADGTREATDTSQVAITFTDAGKATEVKLRHEAIKTEDARRGVGGGWNGCFKRLDEIVAA